MSNTPRAVEIRALISSPNGDPQFDLLTISLDSIEAISKARTDTGGGASIRLKTGHTLLVSNDYKTLSGILIGDPDMPSPNYDAATEAEMLKPPSAEEVEEMLANRRAAAQADEDEAPEDIGSMLGLVEDDDLGDLDDGEQS